MSSYKLSALKAHLTRLANSVQDLKAMANDIEFLGKEDVVALLQTAKESVQEAKEYVEAETVTFMEGLNGEL